MAMPSMRLNNTMMAALQSLDRLGLSVRPVLVPRSTLPQTKGRGCQALSHQPANHFRQFSATPSRLEFKNRVYSSVRNSDQLQTYLQLSSSSRRPLLTLWTTSWCPTCHTISPLLKQLIESGVGDAEGGVTYAEVELDAPDVTSAGLGLTYMINKVPTLLSFDAGEAQVETKVVDGNKLKDKQFLEEWIRTEARRHGGRGGGGSGGSLFGGLFGSFKS